MKNLFLSFGLLASWISVQAQCGTLSPVTLPLSEGFESYSGTVNQDAVLNCTSTYRWDFNVGGNLGVIGFDTDSIMGAHAAVLTGTSRLSDTSQLMLTANMSSYTSASGPIVLSFFYKDGGDSYNAPDKVWVRGANVDSWIEILDWSNTTTNKFWTLASFRLDSILSANSQSFSASTQVLWSRYGGGPYSVAGGLAIDEVLISDGACALPSALAASSVSPGSVVLDWAGSGSAWEVTYGLPGAHIGNFTPVSSKPATISGLATSTTYDFYVRNTCAANSNSAWVGPLSVYIPCNTYQAPYSNDFESSVTGSAPDCWTQYSNISFPSAVVNTAGNPYSGTKQLVMNSSNGKAADTLYAISPQFTDLVAGDKEISIRVAIDNVASKLIVGTTPDASGKGAFTALDTISFSSTFTHKEVFVSITAANGYNGTDQYIVLKHDMGKTFSFLYIDDFDYHLAPTCLKPVDLTVAGLSSSTVDIAFDDRGSGASYEYVWGLPGYAQASGTVQSASTNPFTATGLTPQTEYELLVRNVCGASDVSAWSDPILFTTECVPFAAPYFTDFEADNLDAAPLCWDYYETFGGSYVEVEDDRTHYSGTKSLQLYNGYASTSDTLLAITPQLAGITNGDKQLRFHAQTSHTTVRLIVGTMPATNAVAQFTPIDTIVFASPETYQEYVVTLDAANGYNGTDGYVALMHDMSYSTYIHIDDFNYETIPACAPTQAADITIEHSGYDSVYVSWIPGQGAKFNMEVGPTGFTPGTGTSVTVTNPFTGIGGLTASTTYDIYLKDSCNSGWSRLVGPLSFTTDCSPVMAPLNENFKGGNLPSCWSVSTTTETADNAMSFWKFTGSPAGGALNNGRTAGTYAWVDGSNTGGENNLRDVTLKTPFIDVSSLSVPQLYFEVFSNNTSEPGSNVSFYINLWDGAQWNDSVFSYAGDDADWKDFTVLFNNYSITGPIQLAFIVDKTTANNSSQNDFLLDSVVVQEADACPRPDNFELVSVGSATATFDLNSVNAASYELEWGPRGFQQGSGTGVVVPGITTLPYTLSGVNPNTEYDAYMRVNCTSGGNSVWVGPLPFTTECTGPLAGGTYTIGSNPADDFPSFDTVASVLNACGIAGPVVFNIQPGTYVDALHLYDVPGVSGVNTIHFNGSGNDTLKYNGVGPAATVLISNTNHVTLSGMYIQNVNGADSWGVVITNQSDSVTIDNSIVEVDSTISANKCSAIMISANEEANEVEGAGVDYFTLTNSTLIGGYSALSMEGNGNGSFAQGHLIEDNTIKSYNIYGVKADDLDGAIFRGNTLNTTINPSADGFYLEDITNFTIEKNQINVPDYGIYISDGNEGGIATSNSLIANNMVISTGDNAAHLVDLENTNIYHNTFKGEAGFYMDNHVSVDIRNNIFSSQADYAFEMRDMPLTADVVDYNLYHVGGSQNAIYITAAYADLAAAQTAYPAINANSLEGDPSFLSATDLHVNGVLANDAGDNSVNITTDIDNDARPATGSTAVDMGADEYTPNLSDVGVIAIIDPQAKNCGDTNTTVTVVIKNFGLNAATGFDVNVDVSGDALANLSATYNQSLASLASDTISMVGFNSLEGGTFIIQAYTSLSGDQVLLNDTLTETMALSNAGEISIAASDSTVCGPQAVSLWADTNFAGLPYIWKDVNGNQLGTGDTLNLALVDSTTSVVLSIDTTVGDNFNTFVAGPFDNTIGASSVTQSISLGDWSPIITAYQTVVIDEVKIYPQNSGTLIVDLKDRATGTTVNTVSLQVNQVTAYDPVIVDFDLTVSPGNYELVISNSSTVGQMMKNESGGNYPYGDPSVFEITGQTFGEVDPQLYKGYYYFFYDMTISSVAGCPRPSSTFTIVYAEATTADFSSVVTTITATGADVDFDASTSVADAAATYTWDFGDGNTATGIIPQHTYAANGTYNVKLVVDGTCGKDSITYPVVIEGVSIEENVLSRSLEIYPNPTNGKVTLAFDAGTAQSATVYLSDMTGKVLIAKEFNNLNGKYTGEINLENLPKGTYILNLGTDGLSAQRRVIKI